MRRRFRSVRRIKEAIIVIVLIACSAGCTNHVGNTPGPSYELLEDTAYSSELKKSGEFQLVEGNDHLRLYIKGTTAEIAVEDTASGYFWYSNPQMNAENGDPQNDSSHPLLSQIDITFSDSYNQISNMSSYYDSVALNQYAFEKTDGGIKVVFDIGKREKTYLLPEVITEKRFTEKILANLSEEDQKNIRKYYNFYSKGSIASKELEEKLIRQYPRLADETICVLVENLPDFTRKRIEAIIAKTGYTEDDLLWDRQYNGVEQGNEDIYFRIPVIYRLDGDYLEARVVTKEIRYPDSLKLRELRFLSYFGAADKTDQGYLFVPDGCGALIDLNNGRSGMGAYRIQIYGNDPVLPVKDSLTRYVKANLPVYGMKKESHAFLSIIESGSAIAAVNGYVNGIVNEYNYVYPSFIIDQSETMRVPYRDADDMDIYQRSKFTDDILLRFSFLQDESADYTGMALKYKRYLEEKGLLQRSGEQDVSFFLDLIGAVQYKGQFLGVPIRKIAALTTFEEAGEITRSLKEKGVGNITTRYLGWANGGMEHGVMDTISVQKQLGGLEGFRNLMALYQDSGFRIYPDIDIQQIHGRSLFQGYRYQLDSPKDILGKPASMFLYDVATGSKKSKIYLSSAAKYESYTDQVIHSLAEIGINSISTGDLGSLLYSDFSTAHFIDRQKAISVIREVLKKYRDANIGFLVDDANDYALNYADSIVDLPFASNGYYITNKDVPFYQIVLHGTVPYCGEPLNFTGDLARSVLKLIETGGCPHFRWIYEKNEELKKMKADYYAVSYREWIDSAADIYRQILEASSAVCNAGIIGHDEVLPDVFMTEYDNGYRIYTNYNDTDAEVDSVVIGACSYKIQKVG